MTFQKLSFVNKYKKKPYHRLIIEGESLHRTHCVRGRTDLFEDYMRLKDDPSFNKSCAKMFHIRAFSKIPRTYAFFQYISPQLEKNIRARDANSFLPLQLGVTCKTAVEKPFSLKA